MVLIFTLAVLIGAAGERRALAADADFDITPPVGTYTMGGTYGSFSASTTNANYTITGYNWSATGACLSGGGSSTSFQPTIEHAGNDCGVSCTITYTDNTDPTSPLTDQTVVKTASGPAIGKADRTISLNTTATQNILSGGSLDLATAVGYTVSAGAGDGAITWSGTADIGMTLTNGTVSAGTNVEASVTGITVAISGGTDYNDATSANSVTVTAAKGTITITGITPLTAFVDETPQLTCTVTPDVGTLTWSGSAATSANISVTAAGVVSSTGNTPGTISVTATVTADNYNTATQSETFTFSKRTRVITIDDPGAVYAGSGNTPLALSFTSGAAAAGDVVTWAIDNAANPNITLSAAGVLNVPDGQTGTVTVRASIAEHGAYAPVAQASRNITVALIPVTVTIGTLPASIDLESGYTLPVTVSPAGAGAATWSATTPPGVTLDTATGILTRTAVGAEGTVSNITATVAAHGNYAGASDTAAAGLPVTLIPRTVTITNAPAAAIDLSGGSFALSASASKGAGAVTWAATTVPATLHLEGATGVITRDPGGVGTISGITASVPKDGNYAAATSSPVNVTVKLITPTATFTNVNLAVGDTTKSVAATSSSTGPITYSIVTVNPANAISVNSTTGAITANAVGTATVTFSQAAAGNYDAIAAGTYTCTVTSHTSEIGFTPASIILTNEYGTYTANLSAAYLPAGAVVTFGSVTSSNPSVVRVARTSVSGNTEAVTVQAMLQGDAVITGVVTVDGTQYTRTFPVYVRMDPSYFKLTSWLDYLNRHDRYTEIDAVLHNPGATIGPLTNTYWWVDNRSILRIEWSHNILQPGANSTYYSRVRLKALRSGTTYVHMRAGNQEYSYRITVTGLPYIPSTGQDETALHIAYAALAVSLSVTGVLFLRRRKKQRGC